MPVINGRMQRAGGDHRAVPLHYQKTPEGVAFTLDLTSAYADPALETFVRSFEWTVDPLHQSARLHLTDTFRFGASGGQVVECFISLVQPAIADNCITWNGHHGSVTMLFDPAEFTAEVNVLETKTHQGDDIVVYRLQLQAKTRVHDQAITFTFDVSTSSRAAI